MDAIIDDMDLTLDEKVKKNEGIETKIKFASFGKTRVTNKKVKNIVKKCESCKDEPDDKAIVNDGGVTDGIWKVFNVFELGRNRQRIAEEANIKN